MRYFPLSELNTLVHIHVHNIYHVVLNNIGRLCMYLRTTSVGYAYISELHTWTMYVSQSHVSRLCTYLRTT